MGKPDFTTVPPECLPTVLQLWDDWRRAQLELESARETVKELKESASDAAERFERYMVSIREPGLFDQGGEGEGKG